MWNDALLAYLHFAAIFGLVWFLAQVRLLLRGGPASLLPELLARADAALGKFAMLVLLTGALRAAWGAKGWSFYAHNPVFHVKITLFVLVGLLSIVPTLAFLRWRRAQRADPAARVADAAWRRVRGFVIAELVLVALIPLAAVVMARGLR